MDAKLRDCPQGDGLGSRVTRAVGQHRRMDEIARVLQEQDGVIARTQALAAGLTTTQIARALRRREWVSVHPGVYVDHTGPLSWQQRAWAAALRCWPAALHGRSAMRAHEGPGRRDSDDSLIHLAVDRHRNIADPLGVRLHRVSGFEERVQWNLGPPRTRYDDTVLDLAAAAADPLDLVAVLADACGARRTTARRLLARLEERPWIEHRDLVADVLRDVAEGTCSVLEHGYLTLVERPHGLPVGVRQASHLATGGSVYRDVEYDGLALVVELDGRLFHSSVTDRDRDLERDLDAALDRDATTLRIGFGQVFRHGCATAAKVGGVMQRLGWSSGPTRCAKCGGPDQPG
jgi:hypothetical protein